MVVVTVQGAPLIVVNSDSESLGGLREQYASAKRYAATLFRH